MEAMETCPIDQRKITHDFCLLKITTVCVLLNICTGACLQVSLVFTS